MPRPLVHEHTTDVGTTVELKYEIVDDTFVRVIQYRHRKPGHTNFRRVAHWEGQLIRRDQLPWERKP